MARGDRGLQRVRAAIVVERFGLRERRQATADEQAIPTRPVLVEQEDGLPRGANPSPQT